MLFSKVFRRSLSFLASSARAKIWPWVNHYQQKGTLPWTSPPRTSLHNSSTSRRCTRIRPTPTKKGGKKRWRREHKKEEDFFFFTIHTCITLCTWEDINSWDGFTPKGERLLTDIVLWAFKTTAPTSSQKELVEVLSFPLASEPPLVGAINSREEVGEAGH